MPSNASPTSRNKATCTSNPREEHAITVNIVNGKLGMLEGHTGQADLGVRADTQAWLKIAGRESSPLWPVVSGKLKIRGNPLLLMKFQNCIAN